IGQIDKNVMTAIDRDNWTSTRVGDVFAGLDVAATIPPDLPIDALLKRVAETGTRKFLVVDDHRLMGIITLANLIGHLHRPDQRIW
ncbi:MAG: CBS domain-containing protein, partial [Pseudomonadota bacterium]